MARASKRLRLEPTLNSDSEDNADETHAEDVVNTSPVQPQNTGWVIEAWNCNASADVDARNALGIELMYVAARQIGRCSTEYPDQVRALTYAVLFRDVDPEDPPHNSAKSYSDDVKAHTVSLLWISYFPGIKEHLDYLAVTPALILHLGQYVSAIAGKVRSDDLGRLNNHIISYSQLEDPNNILKRHSNCGFEDSRTGRLLCPVRHLERFEADPARACSLFRNHLVKITSYDFPSFMTDVSKMDAEDLEAGFLRGPLLVTYYKAIFCGRSSVFGLVPSRGQQSVAAKYKMSKVNMHSIVYVALLARSALSSESVWSDVDSKRWEAPVFLEAIMDLAHKSPSWHQEILAWWNKQIYDTEDNDDSDAERDLQESDYFKMLARRANKSPTPSVPLESSLPASEGGALEAPLDN
ncbi:hypothetical protein DICSQDRAFT_173395 [Dichomitus squalens LYAD-421 SS1]|uniref:Uncharacterized protein n=1 Tax=Dichomitus squalens (strain LYAD-421) TaxID=732165 RepID=R7SPJ9_DICSQ|nr:uncharacterized protein DICSQDRAFT_173395 [Dichomitus squalens LYAD-421 SS1]EJF58026.1 hypothetical protein DICSQDRAFT_173395 [Dichomitus squalens LYAD-421 SS1]